MISMTPQFTGKNVSELISDIENFLDSLRKYRDNKNSEIPFNFGRQRAKNIKLGKGLDGLIGPGKVPVKFDLVDNFKKNFRGHYGKKQHITD